MSKRTRSKQTPARPASDAKITHSVIVPAYKEKLNLRPLTTRLFTAFADSESPIRAENVELIVVDDNSRDGSVEEVDVLQGEGYNVRIVVRTLERGLSSAVVRGFREATGDAMICMDADLQVSIKF
jgi:dolichol-phosphate mannosyltransferase